MSDVFTVGDATLYHGDCLEILPTLPKVDAVITDPPYGQAYKARPATGKHGGLRSPPPNIRSCANSIIGDSADFDPTPILGIAPIIIIWGAHKFAHRLPPGKWLVWDKKPNINSISFGDGEAGWMAGDGAMRIFRHLWNGLQVQSGSAEAERQGTTSAQVQRIHPTQKPVALMTWCIAQAGNPPLILDPYMGSGTTGVACANLGRAFVGIEIDRKYFDIACERIDNAYRQQRMFA